MDALERPAAAKVPDVSSQTMLCSVAAICLLAIAAIDKLTGWELRLQILYLLPVGLATWAAGRTWGVITSAAAMALWFITFQNLHAYSSPFYFYWDVGISFVTLAIFAFLADRLRRLEQVNRGREEKADHAEGDSDHA